MYWKRPRADRKSYALIGNDGKSIKDPRIDALNKDIKAGLPPDQWEPRAESIKRSYVPSKTPCAPSNLRLVEECHAAKVKRKRHLVDPGDLKQRLTRAAESVGGLSLKDASEDQIINALEWVKSPSARFEILRGLKELLRFAKREVVLYNPRPPRPLEIAYMRADRFMLKVEKIGNKDWETYLGALFATGCRFAELPTAEVLRMVGGDLAVLVRSQLGESGQRRRTKNKKDRTAPVLPPLRSFVDRLQTLGPERVAEMRLHEYTQMYRACKKVLKLRIHDLRHSYAVEWGSSGATVDEIASFIGDTREVCREHYLPYCATEDVLLRALKRFK